MNMFIIGIIRINCQKCANCKRIDHDNLDVNAAYRLDYFQHPRSDIRQYLNLRFVTANKTSDDLVTLCTECSQFLVTVKEDKKAQTYKYMWPSFFYALLVNDEGMKIYGSKLWSLIPVVWRHWWIDEVKKHHCYRNVSLHSPAAYFNDISLDILEFKSDIDSLLLGRLKDGTNKHIIPTVLCPWGCTEFIHNVGHMHLDYVLQRFLRKVLLVMPNNHTQCIFANTCREDYIFRESEYECWLFNKDWTVRPSIAFVNKIGPVLLTCRNHNGGTDKHYIHPPRQPYHILPSAKGDQLCHVCIKPRTIKPMKASKYCTKFQMSEQRGSFQGVDTCSVTNFGDFSFTSVLLDESESRSIALRPDINALLMKFQKENQLSIGAVNAMRQRARLLHPDPNTEFKEYMSGSTYVPFNDAMLTQSYLTDQTPAISIVYKNNNQFVYQCSRNWPRTIYVCQKMDSGRYGVPFVSIPGFTKSKRDDIHHLWILCHMLCCCKEIWHIIDNETSIFYESKWEGWLMSYCANNYFKNLKFATRDNKNPFKQQYVSSHDKIALKINQEDDERPYFNYLSDHNSIEQVNTFDELHDVESDDKKVIVIHNNQDTLPDNFNEDNYGIIIVNEIQYELRCLITFNCNTKWNGTVYARHGGYHKSWWVSHRKANFFLQTHEFQIHDAKIRDVNIFIYVRIGNTTDNRTSQMKFMRYIGGQDHILCHKHHLPLITSAEKVNNCNCGRKECLTCPEINCKICICKKCANAIPDNEERLIYPPSIPEEIEIEEEVLDDNDHIEDSLEDSDHIEDSSRGSNDTNNNFDPSDGWNTESDDDISECEINIEPDNLDDFVTSNEIDDDNDNEDNDPNNISWFGRNDETETNDPADAIPTTHAGKFAFEIEEEIQKGQYVSGHVIMNQCGSLLTRKNNRMNGYNSQKNFLQKLCATTICDSVPLLYPEGMMFPSIFYAMAENDNAILGAIPSSLFTGDQSFYGFATMHDHIHTRLTNALSATSTNPTYASYCYDKLTNLSLNHQDSRIVLNRGLTVDSNTTSGMGVRCKNDSSLFEAVDSKQMVRNLCASQKYHKMDLFLTFTCNQKKHFGIKKIRNWIDSGDWKQHFPRYIEYTIDGQKEINTAIEQSAASLLLRNWMETKILFIKYLLHSKSSCLKSVSNIFARDEYQKDAGNLPHIHAMISIDWKELNQEQKSFVEDLVSASVCDIVPTKDVV